MDHTSLTVALPPLPVPCSQCIAETRVGGMVTGEVPAPSSGPAGGRVGGPDCSPSPLPRGPGRAGATHPAPRPGGLPQPLGVWLRDRAWGDPGLGRGAQAACWVCTGRTGAALQGVPSCQPHGE